MKKILLTTLIIITLSCNKNDIEQEELKILLLAPEHLALHQNIYQSQKICNARCGRLA